MYIVLLCILYSCTRYVFYVFFLRLSSTPELFQSLSRAHGLLIELWPRVNVRTTTTATTFFTVTRSRCKYSPPSLPPRGRSPTPPRNLGPTHPNPREHCAEEVVSTSGGVSVPLTGRVLHPSKERRKDSRYGIQDDQPALAVDAALVLLSVDNQEKEDTTTHGTARASYSRGVSIVPPLAYPSCARNSVFRYLGKLLICRYVYEVSKRSIFRYVYRNDVKPLR